MRLTPAEQARLDELRNTTFPGQLTLDEEIADEENREQDTPNKLPIQE